MSLNAEIGGLLSGLREKAKVTQSHIAAAMGKSQASLSRLEAGDIGATPEDYAAYLTALGTPDARNAQLLISTTWKHLPRPPLQHPDIEDLIAAETALDRLSVFLESKDVPRAVGGQAEMLVRRIHDFGDFLRSLKHRIAWIGDIGVGKTTAACRQAGLVVNAASAADLRGVILDTGGGRVTLCEVSVVAGSSFAIEVEPLPDEEVYRLVADFCRSVQAAQAAQAADPENAAPSADFRLAEETERALRNMCGLTRPARRKGVPTEDPAFDILAAIPDLEEFKAEVASRLTLWRRTRRQITFEGADEALGRQWLKDTFAAINNGRHAEFSLPGRITVTVPFRIFHGAPYEVELIDTRGVDQSAVRPDIVAQLKDRRTVSVLCSRFNSAPDVSLQGLLQHMAETEVDAGFKSRAIVLGLARPGEALEMRDDSGRAAEDAEDGYDIKRGHVEDALTKVGAGGLEVEFFDSRSDDPSALTAILASKIGISRASQSTGLKTAILAVDQMLANVAKAQTLAVFEAVNHELTIFADLNKALKRTQAPVWGRLINALSARHPRTVWAATRRKGNFWNFSAYQHLGDGAAAEAKRRSAPALDGLRAIINNKLADPELASAHGFLGQLLDDLGAWEADFVEAARHHAISIYKPKLTSAQELWDACEEKYGIGLSDYRGAVAAEVQAWLQDEVDLAEKVERRIQKAWRTAFIQPLRKTAGEIVSEDASD
jgi:transcriptional regulator with XRE-family HTH domain